MNSKPTTAKGKRQIRDLPSSVANYWQKRRIWDRFREEEHPVIGVILQAQREYVVAAARTGTSRRSVRRSPAALFRAP